MKFFDTHAHLCDEQIWSNRSDILQRMKGLGVSQVLVICTGSHDLERAEILRQENFGVDIRFSAATGPNEVMQQGAAFFPEVEEACHLGLLHAIGETGLDRHWQTSPIELQKTWFIRYLELARQVQLPVIIHCREAFEEIIDILDAHFIGKPGARGGIFHCFVGDMDEAQEVIDRGFLVSFSGIITYKSALELQAVAAKIPATSYVIETDSPYLTPGKDRRQLNEPGNVILVAEMIARLRGESLSEVARQSTFNGERLFSQKQGS